MIDCNVETERNSPEKLQMMISQEDKDLFKEFRDILTEEDIDYAKIHKRRFDKLIHRDECESMMTVIKG